MRGVLDGVDPGEGTRPVGDVTHGTGVDDRPDRIRRPWERDHPGLRTDLPLQICKIQRGVGVHVGEPDSQPAGQVKPRRYVGVVI
jgi:hypothetical protein